MDFSSPAKLMRELINLIEAHPVYSLLIGKAVWGAFVDAFPAPTKDSSPAYRFAFTFVNLLAFNFARAKGAAIENSPNFIPAAQKYAEEQEAIKQRLAVVTDWQKPQGEK